MEDKDIFFKDLEIQYGISIKRIINYYERLMNIECVKKNDETLVMECLERIVQDASTNDFLRENKKIDIPVEKTLNYIISDALFNVYRDDALPYLDEKYIEINHFRHKL